MANFELSKVRNLGIVAHIDAGKTTTTDHVLYFSGAKHRLGEVDAGTTDSDYDTEEQNRGITIYSACVPLAWREHTLNLIDTPGHVDFTAEVERSLRVLDGCVVVFDAQKGVEAQSETVWRQANKYQVPRIVFVNKMDVVGANFANVLEEVRERLEGQPVAVNIPIGAGSIKDSPTPFRGVVDLIEMKALFFEARDQGKTMRTEAIPAELASQVQEWREKLFDALTKHDDQDRLTSAYLEGKPIAAATIRAVLREQTLNWHIQPVLCGSGREHIGIQPLMDAVVWYLPSPLDRPPVTGTHPSKPDKIEKRKPDAKEPFCGLVFKVVSDSHGEVFFVRVYSGTLKPQSRPLNPGKNVKELVSKLHHVYADPTKRSNLEEIGEAQAGDIVVLLSLRDSITGDTLCDPQHPILLEAIQFAEAVVSQSIEPESSADKQRLVDSLNTLKREDPTFSWRVDPETGQTQMSGMGLLHLEIKVHRLERDFRLKVRVRQPRVNYRESLKREVKRSVGVFQKQIASAMVDARVVLSLRPGKKTEVDTSVIESPTTRAMVEKAIHGALESGWVGFPVINVRVKVDELRESAESPADLNEMAIQAAASEAVDEALKDNIVLLEPVMRLEVTVPEEYLGAVTADLNSRRAEITELITRSKLRVIEARVPLARMFDYSDKVRSVTQGRASYSMEPHSYAAAPDEVLHRFLHPEEEY